MFSLPCRKPLPMNVYLPRQLCAVSGCDCLLRVAAGFALFRGAPVEVFALGALRAGEAEAGERVDWVEALWIFAELWACEGLDFLRGE